MTNQKASSQSKHCARKNDDRGKVFLDDTEQIRCLSLHQQISPALGCFGLREHLKPNASLVLTHDSRFKDNSKKNTLVGHIIDHIARSNEIDGFTSSSRRRTLQLLFDEDAVDVKRESVDGIQLEDHIFWKNKGKAIEVEEETVGVLTRVGPSLLRYDCSSLELGDGSSHTRNLDTDNQNYLNELQGFAIDILTSAGISIFPSEDPWELIEAANQVNVINQQHLQLDYQRPRELPWNKFSRNVLWNAGIPIPDDEWTMMLVAKEHLQKLGIQLVNETIRKARIPLPAINNQRDRMFDDCFSLYFTTDADNLKAVAELAKEELNLAGVCVPPGAGMWDVIWVRDYLKCLQCLCPHMQDE